MIYFMKNYSAIFNAYIFHIHIYVMQRQKKKKKKKKKKNTAVNNWPLKKDFMQFRIYFTARWSRKTGTGLIQVHLHGKSFWRT